MSYFIHVRDVARAMASTESRASASNPSGTASDSDVGEPPLGDDDRPRDDARPY
jgi:hypothetical protein